MKISRSGRRIKEAMKRKEYQEKRERLDQEGGEKD
jgi:hypothetical protein